MRGATMADVDPGEPSAGDGEPSESDPKADPPSLNKVIGTISSRIGFALAFVASVATVVTSGHLRATLEITAAIGLVGAVCAGLYVYRDRKVPAVAVTATAAVFLVAGV